MYLPQNAEEQEKFWSCYAWPVERGHTGLRAMVYTSYQHFAAFNNVQKYSGDKKPDRAAAIHPKQKYIRSGEYGRDGEMWVT